MDALSTIAYADDIPALRQGRIVERGTHEALPAHRDALPRWWSLPQRSEARLQRYGRAARQPSCAHAAPLA